MIPNRVTYLTAALVQQTQAVLSGFSSELGNPLTVTIFRANPQVPVPAPPHVWIEAQGPRSGEEIAVLGNTVGVDSSGNQQFGAIYFGPLVDIGLRCRQAYERDFLFDALAQAFDGSGINAATGNRWIIDINKAVGVIVADVVNPRLTTTETTNFGPLYEATFSLVVTTVAPQTAADQTIAFVNINPVVVTLNVPMG